MAGNWNDSRPMSPHLQIWRWHPSMMSSFVHRASAIICYIGLIKVVIGLFILALTGSLPLEGLVFSPLGAIGWFIFLFAFIFMALAQLRHAFWNRGAMMNPDLNNTLSYVKLFGSAALALGLTLLA